MKKKLLSIIMALMLVLSFTACGNTQENEEAAQANATVAEETTTEPTTEAERHPDAISWKKAYDHVGETVTIKGTVKGIFQSTGSNGSPTFINIGRDYPEDGRVTVLVWEENLSNFDDLYAYEGEKVFVTGEIYMYDGVAQIEVSDPDQIEVE